MITKKEAAIISAYTGVLLGEFSEMCKYAEQIMGRAIWTHEYANEDIANEIKQKSKKDFCSLGLSNDGTPAEDRHGREPDKVKPLAQYLDEYLVYEGYELDSTDLDRRGWESWQQLLKQALDAYESTENVKIKIERV